MSSELTDDKDKVYQVWSVDKNLAKAVLATELMFLSKEFDGKISLGITDNRKDFVVYADDNETERKLEKWMKKNAPLASYRMMTLAQIVG